MTLEDFKNIKKDHSITSVKFLERNEPFKNELIKLLPDLESDIESASKNENCSCKNSIIHYINENKDSYLEFLYNFLVLDGTFADYIVVLENYELYFDYSGKIAKTSIEEWDEFSKQIKKENAVYNGFSVLKDGNDLLVFFL
jgi:hypothetical protein